MAILIVSDIHGSAEGIGLVKKAIGALRPEKVLSAGDQCPDPMEAAFFAGLVSVRGNCDRFYEYGSIPFPPQSRTLEEYGRRIFMTHGDRMWADSFSIQPGDVFISGHTHVPLLEERDGIYFCNPGSPSRPRSSAGPSAALLDERGLSLLSILDLRVFSSLSFSER